MVTFAGVTVMFLAGVPLRWFVVPGGLIAVAIPIIYQFLHGYQKKRIDTFLDPGKRSARVGLSHHAEQDRDRVRRLFGKGYLQGSQSHLHYLPEGHTDFAFRGAGRGMGDAGRDHWSSSPG
jgi:rod shape determining protein RodA